MSPHLRTVKTASGARAVQIVHSSHRGSRDIEHIGSAHDDAELEILKAVARQRLAAGQGELNLGRGFGGHGPGGPLPIASSRRGHLLDALGRAYDVLVFARPTAGDGVFRQVVLARIIEPASKLDSLRVLEEAGVAPASYATLKRRLLAYAKASWRSKLSAACAAHARLGPGQPGALGDARRIRPGWSELTSVPKRPDRILAGIARGTALPLTPPRGIEGTNGTLSKVELYGEDPRAGTRVQAALALLDQGFRRLVAGRHEEAVDAFDEVMVRYLNDDDPAVRHEAAPALLGKAMALRQLSCSEEAISLCEAAVAANGTAAEPHLRDVAVSALDLQIDLLYELGRAEAASEAYAQLAVRFAEDPEPAIREVVVRAVHKQAARSSSGDGGSPGAADQGAGRGPRRRPALWGRRR